MWWRVFVPCWRFFDRGAGFPELLARLEGEEWRPVLQKPEPGWGGVVLAPEAGLYHAHSNLLERLVQELADHNSPQDLVSYRLTENLVREKLRPQPGQDFEFKIELAGEEVLHGRACGAEL